MPLSLSSASHILLVPLMEWGHARPQCVLATRLVSEREDIVVTLFTAPNMRDRTNAEISRLFQGVLSDERLKRIRVVSTFHSSDLDVFKLFKPFLESYATAYETLSQGKPITCATTGVTFDGIPAPKLVILDFFSFQHLEATRFITGRSVPVIACVTGHIPTLLRFFGHESIGGIGDFFVKIVAEAEHSKQSVDEIGDTFLRSTNGTLIKVPGMPPLYDYEMFPERLPFDTPLMPILRGGHRFFEECDGAILSTVETFDKLAVEAMRKWFLEEQKTFHVVGPLLPDAFPKADIGNDSRLELFLGNVLAQYGERSLLYISFGSIFWPASADYLEEIIDALLEKSFPFILCHASPFAHVSAGLTNKIQSSGLGILIKWAPQQYILGHPATGWFLSHCGHGGVLESLHSGIPLICWPFDADQPGAAAHLSEDLKVAFEPIQIKAYVGKPVHRNGKVPQGSRDAVGTEFRTILDACRGQEGKELRRNAEQLKSDFSAAWNRDGVARKEFEDFLNSYI